MTRPVVVQELPGCARVTRLNPKRVARLMLYGAYADGTSITPSTLHEAIVATVRSHGGIGSRLLSDIFLGGVDRNRAGTVRAVSAAGRQR
jgi:hypothetical protein